LPIKILQRNHTELVGTGYVLLTASNTTGPVELHPGPIVEDVALTSRAYAIIGKNKAPDNEHQAPVLQELKDRINSIIEENRVKCILEIRSKQDSGIEIQTSHGEACSEEISSLIHSFLSKDFLVSMNHEPLESQKQNPTGLQRKNQDGTLAVQSVRITIGGEELAMRRDKLVDQLAELVGVLNVRLGFDPASMPAVKD
jgi:hypothetical protein